MLIFRQIIPILAGNIPLPDDFSILYHSGKLFLADHKSFYGNIAPDNFHRFIYPPPSILLFACFALVRIHIAYVLFILLNLAAYLLSIHLLIRTLVQKYSLNLTRLQQFFLYMIFLTFGPLIQNLRYGQVNGIVLLLCVAFLWSVVNHRALLVTLFLVCGFWFKLYPVILLPLALILNNKKAFLFAFITGIIVIPLILIPVLPLSLYNQFFFNVISSNTVLVQVNPFNQSFIALLMRLSASTDNIMNWDGFMVPEFFKYLNFILLALSGLMLLFLYLKNKKRRAEEYFIFSLPLMVIFTYLGWEYTYILCFPLLMGLVLLTSNKNNWIKLLVLMILIGFSIVEPGADVMRTGVTYLGTFLMRLFYSRYLILTIVSAIILVSYYYKCKKTSLPLPEKVPKVS